MKIDIKKLIIIAAFVFLLTPVATVSARQGSEDSSTDSSTSQSEDSSNEAESENEVENEVENETETEATEVESRREKIRERNKVRSQEIKKEQEGDKSKKKSPEELQKKCEERKKGLETKLQRLSSNATKHQARISAYLDKIVAYKVDNNIANADVDAAILSALDAKTTSEASVTALAELSPTLNCDSGTVASDVAIFKAAAEQARNDLKIYRKAVKNVHSVIEKIIDAETETETETEGQQ